MSLRVCDWENLLSKIKKVTDLQALQILRKGSWLFVFVMVSGYPQIPPLSRHMASKGPKGGIE